MLFDSIDLVRFLLRFRCMIGALIRLTLFINIFFAKNRLKITDVEPTIAYPERSCANGEICVGRSRCIYGFCKCPVGLNHMNGICISPTYGMIYKYSLVIHKDFFIFYRIIISFLIRVFPCSVNIYSLSVAVSY